MNIELLQMKAGQNAKSRGKLSTHFALLEHRRCKCAKW